MGFFLPLSFVAFTVEICFLLLQMLSFLANLGNGCVLPRIFRPLKEVAYVSYGLFRVHFFRKKKTLIPSALFFSLSISLEIAQIPVLIPREVPITETHHIDTTYRIPNPIDFDTSGPEVSFLPFIVVHRGSRRDPVGHVGCFGVKYLQVAAALVVQYNSVHIGPRFGHCKE